MLRKAGVKRIENGVYGAVQTLIWDFLHNLCRRIVIFTEYNQRITVQTSDLNGALESIQLHLAAGINPNANITFHSSIGKGSSGRSSSAAEGNKNSSDKRKHKFRPGTVALREIRREQKNTYFAIPKTNFKRLVKEICQDFTKEIRFEDGILDLIHVTVEEHIISICKNANNLAKYTERITLTHKDLGFIVNKNLTAPA
jgi:histone H3/H4